MQIALYYYYVEYVYKFGIKKKTVSLSYNLNFYNAAFPGNTQALSISYSLTNCHWSACTPTLLVCLANGYRYLTHKAVG